MQSKPARLGAVDIANTVDGFVQNTDVFLTLAGRYDGLDLPDEQCRLLVLSESPAAINPLERHLSERWKMGPVLRKRERTRLIQGMGRCTRNATDFAIIVWLGQSLVNAATSSALMKGFPSELAAETSWEVEQSELAAKTPDQLITMMLALIKSLGWRRRSFELFRDIIILARDTGMRNRRELYRIRIENLDWKNRTIFVPDSKTPDGRRMVPMSDRVYEILRARARGKREGWVFPSKRSKCGHLTNMAKRFRLAREKAGLPEDLVLYCGRHDYGTRVLSNTGNLPAVMKTMGHRDVKTAMKYQHPELEIVRAALNQASGPVMQTGA
jgi:integrase